MIHLDQFYWRPGWRETPSDEWDGIVRGLIGRESWIMDGNYGGTLDIRLEAAEAVIFLDFPRTLCIRRVMARRLRYARRIRLDMASGCPEHLTFKFLKYLWRYPVEQRPGILEKLERRSDDKIVQILRSPEQVHEFVAGLEGRKNISGKR
ncbi:MAG: AAA family ATPase [Rubrobacteraceae bacterium]